MSNKVHYGQYVVPSSEECAKLSVGQPAERMLPLDVIKEGCDYIKSLTNPLLLQYGDIKGYYEFRKDLALNLGDKYKNEVNPDNLFITNGNSDALYFILSLLLKPNSTVYVEKPTYFLGINIAKDDLGLNVVPINMDNTNTIDLDELEFNLKKSKDLQILYTIPTCHNPTSYTMSHHKRLKLAELTKKYNLIVVADEVYQLLNFVEIDKFPKPLCYYTDKAISLGSFSKILAPALRLGWMQIKNKELMDIFVNSGKMDSSGGSSPIIQAMVHGIILNGSFDKNILRCREILTLNCNLLSRYVNQYLSDHVEFKTPNGGYFLWLKLINGLKVKDIVKYANLNKVTFVSGSRFSTDNSCDDYLRLSFSYYEDNGFEVGCKRLKEVMDKLVNMKNKIRVAVCGYNGRLGKRIVTYVNEDNKLYYSKGIGRDMNYGEIDEIDVVVDVSSAEGCSDLLDKLIENNSKVSLIIGSTGDLPHDKIKEYSKKACVVVVSNFSYGIPKLCELMKSFKNNNWSVDIKEKHHINKKDSPSGTSKRLADNIGVKHSDIESIREGEVIGEHVIELENEYEKIVVEHIAKDRDLFAKGAK